MDELFKIFETLGLPYFRQGTLSEDNYPESFFTFDNFDTPLLSFYENGEKRYAEKVMIYFYTIDPKIIYSKFDEFIKEAKLAGFVVESRGRDTPTSKSEYLGRSLTVDIIHKVKEEKNL